MKTKSLLPLSVIGALLLGGISPAVAVAEETTPGVGTATSAVPTGIDELLTTAVTDRNQQVVEPSASRALLASGKSNGHYKSNKEKAYKALAGKKKTFKDFGFSYTSATSAVDVSSWIVNGNTAEAQFTERTTLTLKSDRTGPSDQPSTYEVIETATFTHDGQGWVLDSIKANQSGGLSIAVTDIADTAPSATQTTPSTSTTPGLSSHKATPGKPNSVKDPKAAGLQTGTFSTMATLYNYNAMVAYARKWALGRNPSYRAQGNDCANFVSQSLYAGGWQPVTGWYQDNHVWWYSFTNQSWTWVGSQNLANFGVGMGRMYWLSYLNDMGPADVEQVNWSGSGDVNHSMIVTYYSWGGGGWNDIRVSYHSNDHLDVSIWDLYANYPSAAWYALRT